MKNWWLPMRLRALWWDWNCKGGYHYFGEPEILGEPAYHRGALVTNYKVTCCRCGHSKRTTSKIYEFMR